MPFILSSQYKLNFKKKDEFNHLINELELELDTLNISESRILKFQSLKANVNLQTNIIEPTSTESTVEGALQRETCIY